MASPPGQRVGGVIDARCSQRPVSFSVKKSTPGIKTGVNEKQTDQAMPETALKTLKKQHLAG
jgi:hypothetical protein